MRDAGQILDDLIPIEDAPNGVFAERRRPRITGDRGNFFGDRGSEISELGVGIGN